VLADSVNAGLGATGFTLVETDTASGIFVGDFQIPAAWCRSNASAAESVTGLDIEVNYVDFRDASGEIIEVGDSAGVRASTGSVSLDKQFTQYHLVYKATLQTLQVQHQLWVQTNVHYSQFTKPVLQILLLIW